MNTGITYKYLAALIFLAAFLTQTFSKAFVFADYYTNTAAYAKKCINKTKPALKCHGKCQMMKKLAQEEKQDEENPERKAESKNEVLLSSKSFFAVVTLPATELVSSVKLISHPDGKSTDRYCEIFHPPQLV